MKPRSLCLILSAALSLGTMPALAQEGGPLVLADNLKVLRDAAPNTNYRFTGSNGPGQLLFNDEPVNLKFTFKKEQDQGLVKDFALEIQEITTRDPEAYTKGGFSDTSGYAPLIGLEGKPVVFPIQVTFTDQPETAFEVANVPVPRRFGTYAISLVRGDKRQFLASVARVPRPRADATLETVPVFGEGQFMNGDITTRCQQYARMGIRGWRSELSWSEKAPGTYKEGEDPYVWTNYDALFNAAEANGEKIMVTLGGHPVWTRPFGSEPTPASGWRPDSGGYWGTGDWLCKPELYPQYQKWIAAFCARYWKDGKGALWGLENYNEPWEGGGISGWARDARQYRELQKTIATAARSVSPDIRLLAASSIMNTEDKLYSDGTNEMDKYVDIFTDHYVPPAMCYGPMVAAAHGKQSMETETWFVNTEYLLPQGVAQFMASGQKRIAPWHPRVLFDGLPGVQDGYFIPTPTVTATAAFNYFVSGKTFQKLVFKDRLPWVFQFGKDDDKSALLVVFGQLMTIGGSSPKERLWAQVDGTPGGTMTVDNSDGLLQFYDLAGNPTYLKQKQVVLPMNIQPTYILCKQGPVAAAARLAKAVIAGKKPVEILPHDFSQLMAAGINLDVEVHNCLNRSITGRLVVKAPEGITLKDAQGTQTVTLAAGEKKLLQFGLATATPAAGNAYPFSFHFESDAGAADYAENMNVTVVPHRTIQVDGNLDDWKDIPGVTLLAKPEKMDITELMRRPWLDMKDKLPDGTFGEIKLAWDDDNLYVSGRVNDPTPEVAPIKMVGRDENQYFHSAASDQREPYKTFLTKYPGRSFAEVPYVYCKSPEAGIPFRRDRLQFALDVTPDWHDLKEVVDVPQGFHAFPDTDYEYSLYPTDGGAELWRQLAPGVPRIHDFPRQVRGQRTTGPVPGAKFVVKREGSVYTYEAAIPKTELATMKLAAGTTFGMAWKIGNSGGPSVESGTDKAVCKSNGLTLHPYWERSPNAGVRWTLLP